MYAVEDVVWENHVNTSSVQNDILKNAGSNGSWDADAQSVNLVYNNGFAQTIVVETNTRRMFGLNTVNTSSNHPDLDFAFFLNSDGSLSIYESGSNRGVRGEYEAGDSLRISCFNNEVVYFVNNHAIYESQVAPTFPMFVDMSIATTNGTLQDVVVANPTDSIYNVFESNPGASPSYQWTLNGLNLAIAPTATTYAEALSDGDVLQSVLVPGAGGCSGSNVSSNELNIKALPIDFDARNYARIDSIMSNSCLFFNEDVSWQIISGLEINGKNNLVKTNSSSGWDAGAFSYNQVGEGGFMEMVINETNANRMIGLNAANEGVGYSEIDFAFYLNTGGNLLIYENGSNKGNWGAYSTGDTLQIAVVGNEIRYIQNGNIVYTSLNAPTLPLYVDMSISTTGGTAEQITISNPAYGSFSAASFGLDHVNYQWMLNGVADGGNSNSYVNTSLADGDSVYCIFNIDQTGYCGLDTSFISNVIYIEDLDPKQNLVFAIRNDSIINQSCNYAYEEAAWQSLTSLSLNGTNNVTKVGSSTGWDAGAFSYNQVEEGGFMETVVDETNTNRMIGLNATNTNVSYTDIDFAFYLNTGGNLLIYENGSNKGNWGSYSTGDTLRIAVVGNEVRYIQNGNIVYTSLNTPTLPLFVDLSISTVGGTLKDIYVNNTTYGLFSAYVNGADTVHYEWQLNGSPVGSNISTYTNTGLSDGDEVTCLLKLVNTAGCSNDTTELSNTVTINKVDILENVIFAIRNDSIINQSCNYAYEEAAWQSLTSLSLNGTNNVTKVGSSTGWDAGAFSYNQVEEGGFMETVVDETNTNRMIGLNATNTNVSYTDIDFAFYLNTGGNLLIYENGSNKGNWGSYSTGDTLRIAVVGNEVRYIQNGNIVYTSLNTPTLPLFVDLSINTVGGTLKDIYVNNTTYGLFSAYVNGADTVHFEWQLNGSPVGSNISTYTNTGLSQGDEVTCILKIVETNGCAPDTAEFSNTITINQVDLIENVIFAIRNDSIVENSCLFANEDAAWQSSTSVEFQGSNNVTKTAGGNSWNAGAFSYNKVDNGGFMQTIVDETNTSRMVGLNATNTNVNYNDIDFAFYLISGGNLSIYENGSNKGSYGTYSTGDTLRVFVQDNEVKYYKNGNLLYTSLNAPTLPLYVDMSLNTVGGTVKDVTVYNGLYGAFSAFESGADSVSIQWKHNGVFVGTDSLGYFNNSVADGDSISAILYIVGSTGCSDTIIHSNRINIEEISMEDFSDFYVTRESTHHNGCQYAKEEVYWTHVIGLEKNNNALSKTSGSGSWDSDAISGNTVGDNGFLEFVVPQTNQNLMFGLNSNNTSQSYQDMDYAVYCVGTDVRVYENGSNRGLFTTYAANDTFRIDIVNSVVYYLKNGTVFYTSAVAPSLPLFVDCSFSTVGGSVTDVYTGNATHGNFVAYASNVGDDPTYQWKLNGVDVGLDTNIYENDALTDGDVVSCVLVPDYNNCPGVTFNGNEITILDTPPTNLEPDFTPVSTTWQGGTSSDWKDGANWSNGVPFSGYEAVIPSGTPNDPTIPEASYLYDLNVGVGATLNMAADGYLNLYHEWLNDGTFNSSTGTVEFKTCKDTSIFNTSVVVPVNEVIVNNEKHLNITGGSLQIQSQLDFENGNIYNGSNTLIFGDDASWINAASDKHVEGKVQKTGDDAFTFPVGKNDTLYAPISITAPTDVSDHFTAEYFPINPDSVLPIPYDRAALEGSLDHVSACEYWILDRTGGSSDVAVTLSWDDRSCSVTNLADLRVSRWDGALWRDHGNGGVTGNTTAGTIVSVGAVTSFSPFTLASITAQNPLPVELLSFDGTMINGVTHLNWQTASEINCKLFEVQRSKDGSDWNTFASVDGAGNSTTLNEYTMRDESPFADLTYYRLKQIDFNGDYEYSDVIVVKSTSSDGILAYPNPVKDVLELQGLPYDCSVRVVDATGKLIYSGTQSTIPTDNWSRGVYQLKIVDQTGGLIKVIKLVK